METGKSYIDATHCSGDFSSEDKGRVEEKVVPAVILVECQQLIFVHLIDWLKLVFN